MPVERGGIEFRDRAKQLRDYSGLTFGKITPTDIDGLIEYHNKGYVLIETKLENAPMDYGQRLAFERLTDDLHKAKKPTVCVICTHRNQDPNYDIDVAETLVAEYRYMGHWNTPPKEYRAKDFIHQFLSKVLDKPKV